MKTKPMLMIAAGAALAGLMFGSSVMLLKSTAKNAKSEPSISPNAQRKEKLVYGWGLKEQNGMLVMRTGTASECNWGLKQIPLADVIDKQSIGTCAPQNSNDFVEKYWVKYLE